jgi:hypothetical protein
MALTRKTRARGLPIPFVVIDTIALSSPSVERTRELYPSSKYDNWATLERYRNFVQYAYIPWVPNSPPIHKFTAIQHRLFDHLLHEVLKIDRNKVLEWDPLPTGSGPFVKEYPLHIHEPAITWYFKRKEHLQAGGRLDDFKYEFKPAPWGGAVSSRFHRMAVIRFLAAMLYNVYGMHSEILSNSNSIYIRVRRRESSSAQYADYVTGRPYSHALTPYNLLQSYDRNITKAEASATGEYTWTYPYIVDESTELLSSRALRPEALIYGHSMTIIAQRRLKVVFIPLVGPMWLVSITYSTEDREPIVRELVDIFLPAVRTLVPFFKRAESVSYATTLDNLPSDAIKSSISDITADAVIPNGKVLFVDPNITNSEYREYSLTAAGVEYNTSIELREAYGPNNYFPRYMLFAIMDTIEDAPRVRQLGIHKAGMANLLRREGERGYVQDPGSQEMYKIQIDKLKGVLNELTGRGG